MSDQFFYLPYGELAGRTGTTETPYTFVGRYGVYWEDGPLYHMKARYYHAGLKRWISADPIGLAGGVNLYAYAGGAPTVLVDLTGLITIYVHGTYSDSQAFTPQAQSIYSGLLNDQNRLDFQWSGENRTPARDVAGHILAGTIAQIRRENPNEPINVIAHSHGGNVAFEATQAGAQIDTLVTLGTPGRDDHRPDQNNIGNWYNVYSEADGVQSRGGDAFYPFFQETGPARRQFSGAQNIEAHINEGPIETHSLLSGPQGAVAFGHLIPSLQQATGKP